jgi:signal transduction histidine kinase
VRQYYFSDLVQQLQQLDSDDGDVMLAVTDNQGQLVAGSHASTPNTETRRRFSLMFFDPLSVIGHLRVDVARDSWTVEATPSHEPKLADAIRGVNRLLIFNALAWVTLIFGLVLTVRAATAGVELATLRSEFVSSVSHELKAPLATIRAAGDLLVSGRVAEEAGRREYASLMVQEAKRLTRLVNNLLAFSRVADVTTVYSFEPFALDVLVETALQRLRVQLESAGFFVTVNVPSDLPPISADRDAILLMLENLLDNAIRYSGTIRRLEINGRLSNEMVFLEVRDFGRGIPNQDIKHLTKRFYRASNAEGSGTGIGLAIAKRIVVDHGGTLEIKSSLGAGTTVRIILPALVIQEESADYAAS